MPDTQYSQELQEKISALVKEHEQQPEVPPAVSERPRFIFHPDLPPVVGEMTQVYNGLSPIHKGGMVLEKVGRAWRVQVEGSVLIVHDPEDSWWDP